jgi:mycothiol S-conjugate amidase
MNYNCLRLLCVHAHPDDESSKGAPTVAYYKSLGVQCTLVTCTGGEAGDILNESLLDKINKENIAFHRFSELLRAASVIGYDKVITLNYKDSGMPNTSNNDDPKSFARVPLEKTVLDLVKTIRKEKPHVIITYGADQQGYPHPDHIKVHQSTLLAYLLAPRIFYHTKDLEPWKPLKMYYHVFSFKRIKKIHEWFKNNQGRSPFDQRWLSRTNSQFEPITTSIPVGDFLQIRRAALVAHETQIDPIKSPFFFIDTEVEKQLYPFEDYHLAHSRVGFPKVIERDLFFGVASN